MSTLRAAPGRILRAPVTITETGGTVTAVLPVLADEPVFAGHYPGSPVLPGVCVVECADRAALAAPPEPGLSLTSVDSARFHGPVRPGDELTVGSVWSAEDGSWCCRAEAGTARGRAATIRLRYRRDHPAAGEPVAPPDCERELGLGEITALIPHRPPMLLLDRAAVDRTGEWLTATRTVLADEPWGAGRAGYPALLLVESWCQAAGVLTMRATDPGPGSLLLLGSVRGAEPGAPVFPGDRIEHRVRLVRAAGDSAILTGQSVVDGRVVLGVRQVVVAVRPATGLEVAG